MDVLGVRPMKSQLKRRRREQKKGVKVVYISSPMKVKASASEFRALVQELTGRDSDAERAFMEINAAVRHVPADQSTVSDDLDLHHQKKMMIRTVQEEMINIDGCDGTFGFGFCDFPMEFGNNIGASLFS